MRRILSVFFPAFLIVAAPLRSWAFLSSEQVSRHEGYFSNDVRCQATSRTTVDRSTLSLLEHVNLNVPSHEHVLPFYFELLGFGLDPRKAANLEPDATKKTIWANCGASQFHLPYGEIAQKIPGHIGLRYNSLEGLKHRLSATEYKGILDNSVKSFDIGKDPGTGREHVKLVDLYDNTFYCRVGEDVNMDKRQPIIATSDSEEWGEYALKYGKSESECRGLDYVEFLCPKGSASKIATFYESLFDATTSCINLPGGGAISIIAIGNVDSRGKSDQSLLFREMQSSTDKLPDYDGHHIAMYVGDTGQDFLEAYKNSEIAGVVWVNPRFSDAADTLQKAKEWKQFRFKNILDISTGALIMELEHEIRSVEHAAWPGNE